MDLEGFRKTIDSLCNKVRIQDVDERQNEEYMANFEQIRNGLLQADSISAHTVDFTKEAQQMNGSRESRRYWHPTNENSLHHIKILDNLNESHVEINETANHLRMLDFDSKSRIIRK